MAAGCWVAVHLAVRLLVIISSYSSKQVRSLFYVIILIFHNIILLLSEHALLETFKNTSINL